MRFWSHRQAMKAQMSLRKCADFPEPSQLAYPKYGCTVKRPLKNRQNKAHNDKW